MFARDVIKYYYYKIIYAIYGIIRIVPIRKNRIIFMSHRGASQYSDSPMFITEYLLKNYPQKFELIWEVNDLNQFSFLNKKGIKTVKYGSFKDFILLNTSAVCITNAGFARLIKRKGQLRINTWHGGAAYKREDIIGRKKEKITSVYAAKLKSEIKNLYNLMPSSCKFASTVYFRGSFMYKGELLECGLPRNDIMFSEDNTIKENVKDWFHIDSDTNILLVAPTWKDDNDTRNIEFDYGEVCKILEKKTKEKWVVLLRLHHLSNVDINSIIIKSNGKVKDATEYPNVQELLYTASFLITDYSSVIWDFALTRRPIVLFTPDKEEYAKRRGFYLPVEDWSLAYAESKQDLLNVIRDSSFLELKMNSEKHLDLFGSYETGHATEELVKYIVQFCEKNK